MESPDLRARLREVEVEWQLIQSQLEAKQNLATEVRSHLESKEAVLKAELSSLREQLGAQG